MAKERNIPSVVVTYSPHPSVVLGKNPNFKYLTTEPEKEDLIRSFNIDYLVILDFTLELSRMSAEDFLEKIIIQKLNAKYIVIGYNHFFGQGRRGDFHLLQENASRYGYEVELRDAVTQGDQKISSSVIRNFLDQGDMKGASSILGRNYSLTGKVKEGAKRGRTIGFPTANLELPEERILPGIGVYACYTIVDGVKYKGMVNIGKNPTFDGKRMHVEVNILDFAREIYGETIEVQLVQKIRDEVKFSGIEALKQQLEADRETSFKILVG